MLQDTPRVLAFRDNVVALGRGARRGSGFVLGPGRALTLADPALADRVETFTADGRGQEARVIGVDRRLGVAVLELETDGASAVQWTESAPAIGAEVFALGNPGTGVRLTAGAVSADPLTIRSRHGRPVEVIEHTAPLPAGAGGGPLLDGSGSVLGVNALRGDPGFVLAFPAASVRAAIERALAGREPTRLGVALASRRTARRMRGAVGLPERDGLLVRSVEPGTPAATAGVRGGDLLVSLDDLELRGVDQLYEALDGDDRARSLSLGIVRGTDELELAVDLTGAQR